MHIHMHACMHAHPILSNIIRALNILYSLSPSPHHACWKTCMHVIHLAQFSKRQGTMLIANIKGSVAYCNLILHLLLIVKRAAGICIQRKHQGVCFQDISFVWVSEMQYAFLYFFLSFRFFSSIFTVNNR